MGGDVEVKDTQGGKIDQAQQPERRESLIWVCGFLP